MGEMILYLHFLTLVLLIGLYYRKAKRRVKVVGWSGLERNQGGITMDFTITKGAKKLVRFKPLNKFGQESDWDGAPAILSSNGPATFETTNVDFDGVSYPTDQFGEWFILKSNGVLGTTVTEFEGDGHVEGEGEPESIKVIHFVANVTAVAADVESVTSEESLEIPE